MCFYYVYNSTVGVCQLFQFLRQLLRREVRARLCQLGPVSGRFKLLFAARPINVATESSEAQARDAAGEHLVRTNRKLTANHHSRNSFFPLGCRPATSTKTPRVLQLAGLANLAPRKGVG